MLGSEQGRLAEHSAAVAKNAQSRAQGAQGDARAHGLVPQAEALEKSASELARQPGSAWQSPAAGRAVERLRDTRDALRTGDLSAARGMADSAQRSLQEAAGELESEARMFPGHHGETAQRAEHARRTAADADRLSQAIDRAMPEASEHLSEAERQKLRADAESQRKTGDAAEQLKQAFNKGPDGLPLSPEAVEALETARQSMQRAERALDRGRPDEANREQQQAAERLQKLSQALAEKQSGAGGSRPKGGGESASGDAVRGAPVHIPGAEEWRGPTELRRKLLDAMHEGGPAGYEAATQRYYQELMR
jgi:DNA repair exonuclease SbcCD ATPase subunit